MDITLSNALLVPSYPQDIFTVQAATENGARVNFRQQSAELINSGASILKLKNADVHIF